VANIIENNTKWKTYIPAILERNLGCYAEFGIKYAEPDDETHEEYASFGMHHEDKCRVKIYTLEDLKWHA
jgi:hypothetical protein